ncbi:hypothetical protein Zmor_022927 [Zophobas morio]|uniref:Uncharacterized protein n=1 Tax=Zophobas morio TaxID=2755281 RepID=A0AA38HXZ1_9CUCU|nr:hypothetical protein Zmor_022927 [Zophobas morio]
MIREILPPSVLRADLIVLQDNIANHRQELAISVGDAEVLYTLPICDCMLTEKTITVHIRIPVRTKGFSWSLFELIAVPFKWHNQTCKTQHESVYVAVSKLVSRQVRAISGVSLHHCKPFENKLCFLPRFSAHSLHGPTCVNKLVAGESSLELSRQCPMTCYYSTAMTITEVEEETYVITHARNESCIKCNNQLRPIVKQEDAEPSAKKIVLPCHSQLILHDEVIIGRRFPCKEDEKEITITHILPAPWSTVGAMVINDFEKTVPLHFDSLKTCLNENWTLTIPHVNLTSPIEKLADVYRRIKVHQEDHDCTNTYTVHGDSMMLIWNLILSVGLGYVLFRRNPIGMVYAAAPGAHAWGEKDHLDHQVVLTLMCIAILVFIGYIGFKMCKFLFSRKRGTGRNRDNPRKVESGNETSVPLQTRGRQVSLSEGRLELGEEAFLALARGQSTSIIIEPIRSSEEERESN